MGEILIFILFASVLIHQISCIKDLLVSSKKTKGQLIATLIGGFVLLGLMILYASKWSHYLLGSLGLIMFILGYFKEGITKKGFSYSRSYMSFIAPWDKIKRVDVKLRDSLKVYFSGHGSNELAFEKEDYSKIIKILEEYLNKGDLYVEK